MRKNIIKRTAFIGCDFKNPGNQVFEKSDPPLSGWQKRVVVLDVVCFLDPLDHGCVKVFVVIVRKWVLSGVHFEENNAARPNVGFEAVENDCFIAKSFWRKKMHCSLIGNNHFAFLAGIKVDQLQKMRFLDDHDVFVLDVKVANPLDMHDFDSRDQLSEKVNHYGFLQRGLSFSNNRKQVLPLNDFHQDTSIGWRVEGREVLENMFIVVDDLPDQNFLVVEVVFLHDFCRKYFSSFVLPHQVDFGIGSISEPPDDIEVHVEFVVNVYHPTQTIKKENSISPLFLFGFDQKKKKLFVNLIFLYFF